MLLAAAVVEARVPSPAYDAPDPKIFGVGILALIRSSSSIVTRSRPFLRQVSSTARITIPRTKAGIFFIRAAASSSQAIVAGDSGPYSIRAGPGFPGAGDRPLMASSGDPANVPGVWVHR